jgi:nucleotide-binding universal stress UspA family protein
VLHYAVAFARLLGAPLKVVHVAADDSRETQQRAFDACQLPAAYAAGGHLVEVLVRTGPVAEVVSKEALLGDAALVVMGSSRHNRFARLLHGSTSEALIRAVRTPILLVPPADVDVVTITDRLDLNFGCVLAVVNLNEHPQPHLRVASAIAQRASQPLILLTVADRHLCDYDAAAFLRRRAHHLLPIKPRSRIVRRGNVATEISRCAIAERAGLVVMGLGPDALGQSGVMAVAVVRSARAFVLAIPGAGRRQGVDDAGF